MQDPLVDDRLYEKLVHVRSSVRNILSKRMPMTILLNYEVLCNNCRDYVVGNMPREFLMEYWLTTYMSNLDAMTVLSDLDALKEEFEK